jgi:hypothetical protein
VLLACRRVREQFLPPSDVVRESAADENHSSVRNHTDPLTFSIDDRTSYRAVVEDQLLGGRG